MKIFLDTSSQAQTTPIFFERDFPKYSFISIDSLILEQARSLIDKYGKDGLRALDSVQLSTCVALTKIVDAADNLLKSLIEKENLRTTI